MQIYWRMNYKLLLLLVELIFYDFFYLGAYDKWTYDETYYGANLNKTFVDNTIISHDTVVNLNISSTINHLSANTTNPAKDEDNIFCPYTPFMFSFVLILIKWIFITIPFFCCGLLMVCGGYSARKAFKKGDFRQEDPEHLVVNTF